MLLWSKVCDVRVFPQNEEKQNWRDDSALSHRANCKKSKTCLRLEAGVYEPLPALIAYEFLFGLSPGQNHEFTPTKP